MPRKPVIDYKRYNAFKNGYAYCTVPGCTRPEWGYSLTGSNTKSMLKHMRDRHPKEYDEVETVASLILVSSSPPRKVARRRIYNEESLDGQLSGAGVDVSSFDELTRTPPEVSTTNKQSRIAVELKSTDDVAVTSVRKPVPAIFSGLPECDHPKFCEILFTNELSETLEKFSEVRAIVDYIVANGIIEEVREDVRYGPPVDLLSLDEMQRIPKELSSIDELVGFSQSAPNAVGGSGLPEMDRSRSFGDVVCDKVKEQLANANGDRPASTCLPVLDFSACKRGMTLRFGGELEDLATDGRGNGIVMHGPPPVSCAVYEGEGDSSSDEEDAAPSATAAATQKHYMVQKILDKRVVNGELLLLTKWKGYQMPDWQPYKNFDKTNEALIAFELKNASTAAESTDE